MKILFLSLILLPACSISPFKNKEVSLTPLPAAEDSSVKEITVKKVQVTKKENVSKKEVFSPPKEKIVKEELKEGSVEIIPEKETAEKVIPLSPAPWKSGEELKYQINALGFDAAEIKIKVEGIKELRNQEVWHFKMEGKTTGFASKMFYYNLKSESFMNGIFQSMQFQSSSFEGSTEKESLEQYIFEKNLYYVYKKKNGKVEKEKSETFDFSTPFTDAIGFFFRLRTLKVGDKLRVLSNHKARLLVVEKITNETIRLDKKTFNAEKLQLKYDGKSQAIWREKNGSKRILKGDISMSFASGTLSLKNP